MEIEPEIGADDGIDHDSPIPPYRQLVAILTARIRRRDWQPGRQIPSEVQLMGEYGLARGTVRRALDALTEDGLIFVVPQRGRYVSKA